MSLADDGLLVLKAYWNVPAAQVPARITTVQEPGYTLVAILGLAGAVLAGLALFIRQWWASGAPDGKAADG